MEVNNVFNTTWAEARAVPHFTQQPAWTRVATKPLNPKSKLSSIMVNVATLKKRAHARINANAAAANALPVWPGAEAFFRNLSVDPRVDEDAPHKRVRSDAFLPSNAIHSVSGVPDSKAWAVHEECRALVDVANCYMQTAENHLFPVYRSLRNGTYTPPVTTKRRRGMEEGDLQIHKGKFQTICDIMAPVVMAQRDGREEVTIQSAAIAFQAYETYPQNSRYPLVFNGIPALTDITERSEPPSPPKVAPVLKPATVSLDARSDSDIFATAPIAQSPTPTPAPRDPAPIVASPSPSEAATELVPQSPAFFPNSPLFTSEDAKADTPPTVISQLAEAAGNRLDGNANVVIGEGTNGRLFVRFKISAEYAPLFPCLEALNDSAVIGGTPVAASTPQLTPEASSEPATPSPPIIEAPIFATEPNTPTSKAMLKDASPETEVTSMSPLTELESTPVIREEEEEEEEEESPSRTYIRGFIERSRRIIEDNASPTRPVLAPLSPNKPSPVKLASPKKHSPEPASPKKESPKKQASPKKAAAPPTRRSSRLTNKAPKSSIPTPIRIDSRSGAGRVKAAAPDLTNVTRNNTKKNKGKALDPKAVLAAMQEAGPSSPVATTVVSAPKGGKTVQWKTPVEEEPPKRVTRSRAKKIAAARA